MGPPRRGRYEHMSERARIDIVTAARENEAFRREIVTAKHSQLVAMTIPVGKDIGEEVHEHVDQILILVDGRGEAILEGDCPPVGPDDLVFVTPGARRN